MAQKSSFPEWVYDNSPIPDPLGHGERAVQFLRALQHPKSKAPGKAFTLYPWQERIIRAIYGPRDADGHRIVTRVFFYIPRGNRKTTLSAALALLHLIGPEKVPGGEIVFAASDKKQASIAFKEAMEIIRMNRHLVKATKIIDQRNAAKEVHSLIAGYKSWLEVVSSDGSRQNGGSPTFVLADEIHAWKEASGSEMMDVMESGLFKTENSLMVIATTAGRGADGFAIKAYQEARAIATGEVVDPSFLPIMFEMQEGEDWTDEAIWHRCNPGLADGFQNIKDLRNKVNRAKNAPNLIYGIQQYHLNVWQQNSRDPLFDLGVYDKRKLDDDPADLEQLPAYIGIDLSQTDDLSSVSIAFRHDDGQITLRNRCFVPAADLKAKGDKDRAPYQEWADASLIEICPSGIIDEKQVEDYVRQLCATYDVQEIAIDPHLAEKIMHNLQDAGLPIFQHPQSIMQMSRATGELVKAVNGDLIRHDGDPVLRNHLANVAVSTNPQSGLIRMHKQRSNGRIDAAVASAMAVSRARIAHEQGGLYSRDDIFDLLSAA
ncbi:MAG TPA: terminase TerL endonuclease subunit [Paracoccus sp. (in: a-proteobacteria)]|uniref:terminase large subunit n=1 Tax=Paracoccus sp. TaxID=267 RepID=UPI002D1863A2|nr:terminase TerL endonuclease subunit [Paracoccus sp. (in: a-proteobacteria)]HWL56531.1 terminase TerL endonuclease subunit [Paracoccus sp. (in: a-proteobacteria)]